jgi:alkaline phosphatase
MDVVIGAGRRQIYSQATAAGRDPDEVARQNHRTIYDTLAAVPASNLRPIVVLDNSPSMPEAARLAIERLSKNRKGYFLVIEWDAHTDNPQTGLDNLVNFDRLIRELSRTVNLKNTLMVFTADHSFEFRTVGGAAGQSILNGFDEWRKTHRPNEEIVLPAMRVGHSHTGEEVVVAAQGPGSQQVKGFLPNTQLFHIMMNAFGWKPDRNP